MTPISASSEAITDAGPAGPLQTQIWLQDQISAGSGAYNIPTALRFRGPLDVNCLRRALDQIIARHESLRTCFIEKVESGVCSGNPRQIVRNATPVDLKLHDLTTVPCAQREAMLPQMLRAESRRPFNLARDMMIRADLFRLSPEDSVLLVTMHHIASDGWSIGVFLKELKELYECAYSGRDAALPELPIQYADYAAWQREQTQTGEMNRQVEFWKVELAGELPPLNFPLDRPRTGEGQFAGEREHLDFPRELPQKVYEAARQFGVTEFTIVYSAFHALLARYCDQSEIMSGTVVAGRGRTEIEPIIGYFVNLLVIRTKLPDDLTAEEFFEQFQRKLLDAWTHQDVPFDQVAAALGRPASAGPLIQAVFASQRSLLESGEWGPLSVEWVRMNTGTAKFDLNLTIEQNGNDLSAVLEYRTALFDGRTIQSFLRRYLRLLDAMVSFSHVLLWKLPILTGEELVQLLRGNSPLSDYPRDNTIAELFEKEAATHPEAVALVFGTEQMSYGELDHAAESLAAHLVKVGAGPGSFVGICMERSFQLIVSILAVTKCGAAYVPLDCDYPPERLEFLVRDSGATIVLTKKHYTPRLPQTGVCVVELDRAETRAALQCSARRREPAVTAESPAYVMYTSGSTGMPKGVIIPHRGVVRLVKETNYASFGRDEVFLQFAPISFDASTFEIWGALLNGGKLCIAPPGKTSLEDLSQVLVKMGVTTLWLTSALFNQMVDQQINGLRNLRQMLTGGDAASLSHCAKFISEVPSCRLINGYGPTENTTFTACMTVRPEDLQKGIVPIGKPISNTQVYIMDRFFQQVPAGVAGELCTSGDGLALGYLNAPELTARKFLPHPYKPRKRIYRTGDRVRQLPDGNIQFLGRFDQQVKIRGFRIEPAETEHAVRAHPEVRDAAVLALPDGPENKCLVCCWIPKSPGASAESLRAFLKEKLPEHLIPTQYASMRIFPVNANGKIDRKELARLVEEMGFRRTSTQAAKPTNPLEESLLQIWRRVLRNENLSVHDDFFTFGGHSLLATQIISQIKQQLHLALPLRMVFDNSTVAELAVAMRDFQQLSPEFHRAIPRREMST